MGNNIDLFAEEKADSSNSKPCLHFPDEPAKCDAVVWVKRVSAIISFMACIFVIFLIWLFRRYKALPQRLILCIIIAGAVESVIYMIAESDNITACKAIGFMSTYISWVILLWMMCITVHLFFITYDKKIIQFIWNNEWIYYVISWFCPAVVSTLPIFPDVYGRSGVWCWIENDTGWRMGIWYVPLILGMTALFALYISIILKLRKMSARWEGTYSPEVEYQKRYMKDEVSSLIWYPFIYLVVYVFPLAYRIQNAASPDHAVFWLTLLAALVLPLHGLFNAIAFGLDKPTRSKLNKDQLKAHWNSHFTAPTVIGDYQSDNTDVGVDGPSTTETCLGGNTTTVIADFRSDDTEMGQRNAGITDTAPTGDSLASVVGDNPSDNSEMGNHNAGMANTDREI